MHHEMLCVFGQRLAQRAGLGHTETVRTEAADSNTKLERKSGTGDSSGRDLEVGLHRGRECWMQAQVGTRLLHHDGLLANLSLPVLLPQISSIVTTKR